MFDALSEKLQATMSSIRGRGVLMGDTLAVFNPARAWYGEGDEKIFVDREAFFRGIEMLRHGRHDILVFHVMDHEELTFPFAGTTRFEGMEELPQLTCDPRALRDGYMEALEEYLVEVRRGCARQGIDYTPIKTSDSFDAVLSKFLHHRMAQRASAKAPTHA